MPILNGFRQNLRLLSLVLSPFLALPAAAELLDRGNGLIYDTVLDITWLQDASFGAGSSFDDADPFYPEDVTDGKMSWSNAVAWADSLIIGGATNWRLPSMDKNGDQETLGMDGIINCAVSTELECRDNEMGYMFFYNLNGVIDESYSGTEGPFINFNYTSWSSTVLLIDPTWIWGYVFGGVPFDTINAPTDGVYIGAWAVHDGDVATEYSLTAVTRVPFPPFTIIALGFSILILTLCLTPVGLGRSNG